MNEIDFLVLTLYKQIEGAEDHKHLCQNGYEIGGNFQYEFIHDHVNLEQTHYYYLL